MNKVVKLIFGIVGIDLAVTTLVAVQNAIEEKKEQDNDHHKGFYGKYLKRQDWL